MADTVETLGAAAARQLANTTKTRPQWVGTTPRWLVSLLPWVPVEAGTYRVNKVKKADASGIGIECSPSDGAELPSAFVDYEDSPREYTLSTVTTTLEVQTRISGLYRSPMDQVKPRAVIDRLTHFYEHENSNVHRGAHTLAVRATDAYEAARDKVRRFLNAPAPANIVFVRGATEGINLVARSWGRRHVEAGDEIVITWLEHHANIVPWQQLRAEKSAYLRVAPVDSRGQVILEEYERLLGSRTKLVTRGAEPAVALRATRRGRERRPRAAAHGGAGRRSDTDCRRQPAAVASEARVVARAPVAGVASEPRHARAARARAEHADDQPAVEGVSKSESARAATAWASVTRSSSKPTCRASTRTWGTKRSWLIW